jgi:hypothetical protein
MSARLYPLAGWVTDELMKLLVLTTEPVSAAQLREALPAGTDPSDAEVMVVAPAVHESALRFWLSDADEAIEKASAVGAQTLEQLGEAGISASADTGEGDPLEAAQDALRTFEADRIIIFSHAGNAQRYREDVDDAELRERFGIPVDRAELPSDSAA